MAPRRVTGNGTLSENCAYAISTTTPLRRRSIVGQPLVFWCREASTDIVRPSSPPRSFLEFSCVMPVFQTNNMERLLVGVEVVLGKKGA